MNKVIDKMMDSDGELNAFLILFFFLHAKQCCLISMQDLYLILLWHYSFGLNKNFIADLSDLYWNCVRLTLMDSSSIILFMNFYGIFELQIF